MTDLRRKILDASIALVAEQGVRQVSFREVARRAGVSHQAPYHHFGNYSGILRAIAQEGFDSLSAEMREAADACDGDSMQALTEAGCAYVRFARTHPGHFRVMFQQALVDVHDPDAPVVEAETTHGTLVRLATAASEDGYGGLDPETTAHLCWATVHGLASLLVEGILANKMTLTPEIEEALTDRVVRSLDGLMRPPKKKARAKKKRSRAR